MGVGQQVCPLVRRLKVSSLASLCSRCLDTKTGWTVKDLAEWIKGPEVTAPVRTTETSLIRHDYNQRHRGKKSSICSARTVFATLSEMLVPLGGSSQLQTEPKIALKRLLFFFILGVLQKQILIIMVMSWGSGWSCFPFPPNLLPVLGPRLPVSLTFYIHKSQF